MHRWTARNTVVVNRDDPSRTRSRRLAGRWHAMSDTLGSPRASPKRGNNELCKYPVGIMRRALLVGSKVTLYRFVPLRWSQRPRRPSRYDANLQLRRGAMTQPTTTSDPSLSAAAVHGSANHRPAPSPPPQIVRFPHAGVQRLWAVPRSEPTNVFESVSGTHAPAVLLYMLNPGKEPASTDARHYQPCCGCGCCPRPCPMNRLHRK